MWLLCGLDRLFCMVGNTLSLTNRVGPLSVISPNVYGNVHSFLMMSEYFGYIVFADQVATIWWVDNSMCTRKDMCAMWAIVGIW